MLPCEARLARRVLRKWPRPRRRSHLLLQGGSQSWAVPWGFAVYADEFTSAGAFVWPPRQHGSEHKWPSVIDQSSMSACVPPAFHEYKFNLPEKGDACRKAKDADIGKHIELAVSTFLAKAHDDAASSCLAEESGVMTLTLS